MAVTENLYTGNGSTVLYSFTFPYLETTDIKVSVNGTNTNAYTLANATTVQFNTAPASSAAIRIYRQTDDTALPATFYSGSAIRANDLNDDFTQNLYVTQESSNSASTANTTANTALTNSNTAISTANSAVSTANTASSNASAAVSTANTANTNASAAVSTANTASSNASAAVSTANTASSNASTALSTANTALSTANTASTNASAAVTTANTASTNASNAVSTANTASTNASAAVSTANTASSNASTAVSTANTALSTANAAASAVASAILYDIVANVAAIPASPVNNDAVEITNSTGIESFTPLVGVPGGFVGNSGLSVRIVYTTVGSTWNWIQYFPNDPETRYLKLGGGTLTGAVGVTAGTAAAPSVFISGDTNTGIYSPGADQVAISTGGSGRLFVDSAGNVAIGRSPSSTFGVYASNLGLEMGYSSTLGGAYLQGYNRGAGPGSIDLIYYLDGSANHRFFTGGNERLRITSAGLVGVGTSAPATALQVNGDIRTSGAAGTGYELNDSGTKISIPAANSMAFSTGAVERVRVDSSGRVGIGSSSPVATNHIRGSGTSGQVTASWLLENASSGTAGMDITGAAGSSIWRLLYGGAPSTGTNALTPALTIGLEGSAAGRVAIGTTSASSRLHVLNPSGGTGTTEVSTIERDNSGYFLKLYRNAGGGNVGGVIGADSVGTYYTGGHDTRDMLYIDRVNENIQFYTANTERFRCDSSGRLLVGTSSAFDSSADARLQIASNNGAFVSLGTDDTTVVAGDNLGLLRFYSNGGSVWEEGARIEAEADLGHGSGDKPTRLVFSTTADGASSPTERMRIGQNGTILIGITTAYSGNGITLSPTGSSTIRNQTTGTQEAFGVSTGTYDPAFFVKGNGGINNFSANNVNLSDRNAKKDIAPAADTWDCIKEWEIVNYRYKDQPDNADLNLGVIAQQVAESCPEVITVFEEAKEATEDKPAQEERLGVKEQQMYWMAIKALQEAQVRIEQLEQRLTDAGIA